jgi:23S rRNA (adenine2503-C2)-methyltransferase
MNKALNLLGMTSKEFATLAYQLLGKGRLQAESLYKEWHQQGTLYGNHACFLNATRLKTDLLAHIEQPCYRPLQIHQEASTIKFTLSVEGGYETESVILPMTAGVTLCISSQVGCRMGCKFCETGKLGLIKQLSVDEIIRQVVCAKQFFNISIRNIVFMGMGEPMDNLDAVIHAIEILSDPKGLNIGRRHITVSTSGHLEGLARFMKEVNPPVNLAVSVIAADNETRTRLMPVNRRWNMTQLKEAMKTYCQTVHRTIFIEYVLIKGINDSLQDADLLAEYLQDLDVKVNLIPYNQQSASLVKIPQEYSTPETQSCLDFAAHLRSKGFFTIFRTRLGNDIMAACGQLGNMKWKKRTQAPNSKLALLNEIS